MRCNDINDAMRFQNQQLKFGGMLGPQAKKSAWSQGPKTDAVLPSMVSANERAGHVAEKLGNTFMALG
jgi:hypothetical protein